MLHKPSRTVLALLVAGLPFIAAQAQVVVPPPINPEQAQSAKGASAGPMVLPPARSSSVNPAASVDTSAPPTPPAPPAALIDIALPAAPKAPVQVDLKPTPPAKLTSAVAPKPKASSKAGKAEGDKEKAKPVVDPFAGVVGLPVSDSQLNRFVFPEPVEGIFFQEGAPLPECPDGAGPMDPCKPVFLNNRKMMLLQLRAGAKGPVQMLAHLTSGRVVTLNLMPAAGPGAVIRVDGAEDGRSDAALAKAKSESLDGPVQSPADTSVAMLSRFAKGDIPAGFESVAVSRQPIRFEHFDVHQLASWSDGSDQRVHLFQVRAHGKTPVAISPALFRHENVKALALDTETITNTEPAMLYMVEQVPAEAQ